MAESGGIASTLKSSLLTNDLQQHKKIYFVTPFCRGICAVRCLLRFQRSDETRQNWLWASSNCGFMEKRLNLIPSCDVGAEIALWWRKEKRMPKRINSINTRESARLEHYRERLQQLN